MSVLLDEWTLKSAVFDGPTSWPANNALRAFEDAILRGRGLAPVRFVSEDEYAHMFSVLGTIRSSRIKQSILRLLPQFVCTDEVGEAADVPDAPKDLSTTWLRSLATCVRAAGDDWRAPQVVFPGARITQWPDSAEITGTSAGASFQRVLAQLERYEEHRYACIDRDPWDQRRLHPPSSEDDGAKPRLLPKHPELRDVPLRELVRALDGARRLSRADRNEVERWYYVPPRAWNPAEVTRDKWRDGAFPRGEMNGRSGYVDEHDHVWAWHPHERHWDVQTREGKDEYQRISHDGSLL